MDVSNKMFWRLQTQFRVWEGWRGVMFCLHFGFSVHTICHVLRQVRNLEQCWDFLKATWLIAAPSRAAPAGRSCWCPPRPCTAFSWLWLVRDSCPQAGSLCSDAFLGSLIRNQGLQIISLICCQRMTVLEEISKPRLDEKSPTLLLISAEFWASPGSLIAGFVTPHGCHF